MFTNKAKFRRFIFLAPFILAAVVFGFSYVVMLLWNAVIPAITGFKLISFWQAMGLLVLSKILFGGLRMGGGGHKMQWKQKWQGMSPEERERFKAEWKQRCGRGWRQQAPAEKAPESGTTEAVKES